VRRLLLLVPILASLAAPAQAKAPARMLVEAREYHFTLSRTVLKAGPAIIQLADRGEDPHDFRLVKLGRRVSARTASVPETVPGQVTEWRGRLSRGRYQLICTLPGHAKLGMHAFITVR
jgi:plastocyanin